MVEADHPQLLNFNLSALSNDTVIDVWLSPDSAKQVADKGHRMVLASYDYFYLVSIPFWLSIDG